VIDEVGFQPMIRQEASLFFRLVSYRPLRPHGKGFACGGRAARRAYEHSGGLLHVRLLTDRLS